MTRILTTILVLSLAVSGLFANDCNAPAGLLAQNTNDGVLLSWDAANNAVSYRLKVENANNNPQLFEIEIPVNGTSHLVTGLNANASYKFKVRTVCSGDKSDWTNYVPFSTAVAGGNTGGGNTGGGTGTCAIPEGLGISNLTGTSAVLSWSPVAGALKYEVEVEDDENTPLFSFNAITTDTTIAVIGLTPGGSYQFKVKSKCDGGLSSDYSAWVFFGAGATGGGNTGGGAGGSCEKPANLEALQITTTSALLTWSPVAGALKYEIEVEDDENTVAFSFNALTADTAVLIIGLTPGGNYQFKVKSLCGGGMSSDYSEWSFFSTNMQLVSPAVGSAGSSSSSVVQSMSAFQVFPNPATTEVAVQLDEPVATPLSVMVMNAQGRQLVRHNNLDGANGRIDLSVANLDSGLYVVVVSNGQFTQSKQLLIAR